MVQVTNPLGYAPKPKPSRWRIWLGVLFAIILASGWFGWRWSHPLREQAAYLRLQSQCCTWSRPSNTVVYEEESEAAARLLAAGGEYVAPRKPLFDYPDNRPPPGWTPPALYDPKPWREIGESVPDRDQAAIVFLHARSEPTVGQRLVVVRAAHCATGPEGHSVQFGGKSFHAATATPGSRLALAGPSVGGASVHVPPDQRLRVFAGQPDPDDASHFTIGFELNGVPGVIDGWLRDRVRLPSSIPREVWSDREAVELHVRDGPGQWIVNGRYWKAPRK